MFGACDGSAAEGGTVQEERGQGRHEEVRCLATGAAATAAARRAYRLHLRLH